MNGYSTILLPKKLKSQLDKLKEHDRESYAHIIEKLMNHLKECDESKLELSDKTLKAIAEGKEDLAKGRVFTSKQMAKELGL